MEEVVKSLKVKYRNLGKEQGINVIFPTSEQTIILQYEKWSIASYVDHSYGYFHVVIECYHKRIRNYIIPKPIHFLIPFLLDFWKECSHKFNKPFFTVQDEIIDMSQIQVEDLKTLQDPHLFSDNEISFLITHRRNGEHLLYYVETEKDVVYRLANERKQFFKFLKKLAETEIFFNFYFSRKSNFFYILTEETGDCLTWSLRGNKSALYNRKKEFVVCFEKDKDHTLSFLRYLDVLKTKNRLQHLVNPAFVNLKYVLLEKMFFLFYKHDFIISKLSTLFTTKEIESYAAHIIKTKMKEEILKKEEYGSYRYSWFSFLQKKILIIDFLSDIDNPAFYSFDNETELIHFINKHKESINKKASV